MRRLVKRKWERKLICICCSCPSTLHLAYGRLGWYTAALQMSRSTGLPDLNSSSSFTKERTFRDGEGGRL